MVANLKKKNLELQKDIKARDRVVHELKMDARGTKLRELAAEKQAFE